jgi:SpoVK/Ycf46/Vps4 family AAA+-type ATPase/DNA-binding transcriptional MerR regulator
LSIALSDDKRAEVEELLKNEAARSVFVKGYHPHTLHNTLPMAPQPKSPYFEYPAPITLDSEVLDMLDDELCRMITQWKEEATPSVALPEESTHEPDSKLDPSGGISAHIAEKPSFDHYPPALKVGDVVRRGMSWKWGDQDTSNGTQCNGIVESIGTSAHSCVVKWYREDGFTVRANATRPPKFGQNTYRYDTNEKDLFLVDPDNPSVVPAGTSATLPPSQAAARFKPGDLIRLTRGCQGSSLCKQIPGLQAASQGCLNDTDRKLGVVIHTTSQVFQGQRTSHARQLALHEKDSVFQVMELTSGTFCFYPSTDLLYADGSEPGHGKPTSTILSVPNAGPMVSPPCFLVGERVTLADSFTANNGYGWCLGTVKQPLMGLVCFAPPIYPGASEQRNIRVIGLGGTQQGQEFEFRASWLQRSLPPPTQRFQVGDRVQLNYAMLCKNTSLLANKCLSVIPSLSYGIVRDQGIIRDGMQRNIMVEAVGGEQDGKRSLYPVQALDPACRRAFLSSDESKQLLALLQSLEGIEVIPLSTLQNLVTKKGLHVWSQLSTVCDGKELQQCRQQFERTRTLAWPIRAATLSSRPTSPLSSDTKESQRGNAPTPAPSSPAPVVSAQASPQQVTPAVPTCSKGHGMKPSTYSGLGYQGGWKCDVCCSFKARGTERWFCMDDGEDICFSCRPKPPEVEAATAAAAAPSLSGSDCKRSILFSGSTKSNINGEHKYAGQRNGQPCYSKVNGPGCIFFDGTYWKACQKGDGLNESGWNYSQKPTSSGELPIGPWMKAKRTHESEMDYSQVELKYKESNVPETPPGQLRPPQHPSSEKIFSCSKCHRRFSVKGYKRNPGRAERARNQHQRSCRGICRFFSQGNCRKGSRCSWSHELGRAPGPEWTVTTSSTTSGSTTKTSTQEQRVSQEEAREKELQAQQLAQQDIEDASLFSEWKCGKCTAVNVSSHSKCIVCGQRNQARRWTCPRCTCTNTVIQKRCRACRTEKDIVALRRAETSHAESQTKQEIKEIKVGDHVQARWDNPNQTYDAEVKKCWPDGTYSLAYSDGTSKRVSRDYIKTSLPVKRGTVSRYLRQIVQGDIRTSAGNESTSPLILLQSLQQGMTSSGSTSVDHQPKQLSVGDQVKAYFGGSPTGKQWDCEVLAVNPDGTYKLRYSDGDVRPNVKANMLVDGPGSGAAAINVDTLWSRESGSDDEEEEEDVQQSSVQGPDENSELSFNTHSAEAYHFQSPRLMDTDPPSDHAQNLDPPVIIRQTSEIFYSLPNYEPLDNITELIKFQDKAGNSAAHHAAFIGLIKSAEALFQAGASRWLPNRDGDTPAGLLAGLTLGIGQDQNTIHQTAVRYGLVPTELVNSALNIPVSYEPPGSFKAVLSSIHDQDEDMAAQQCENLPSDDPRTLLYSAFFKLSFGFGTMAAQADIKAYLNNLEASSVSSSAVDSKEETEQTVSWDPFYFLVAYLIWKQSPALKYSVQERVRAAAALRAARVYPCTRAWLTATDNEDEAVLRDDLQFVPESESEEDQYTDLFPPPQEGDPEIVWARAKAEYSLSSPAMDSLMQLVGLKIVKETAVSVVLRVLLEPPADLQSSTAMNFLFLGNPGCGKTIVSQYLAQALVDLGVREENKLTITTANDLLSEDDPQKAFKQMVADVTGGTMVICKADKFDPAPRGSRANDSNKILNHLLKVSETLRHSTTFILSGFPHEMEELLAYDPGFQSRFPKLFAFTFHDYSEVQLTKILFDMATKRGFKFQSSKQCGVPIARCLCRRLHRGAQQQGFGNARLCEKALDQCILNQNSRLLKLKLKQVALTDQDYRLLTREDCLGVRPNLEENEHYRRLMDMHGLSSVKQAVTNLMQLQLQNYDAEMRGERTQTISLHRIFLGNAGTGKTTVAELLGKMLHDFGFLSDGGVIKKTPADLMGSSVGEGVERTKDLFAMAKGKVIFIDEAYNLDPQRHGQGGSSSFGGQVLDTMVEKMDASAGMDMCVILAGYRPQMEQLLRNCNNQGFQRRFNLDQAFEFADFSDSDLRHVLKQLVVDSELQITPQVLDFAIQEISKKRMLEGFGNAGEARQILDRANLRLSARLSSGQVPLSKRKLLIRADFVGTETSAEQAREAFAGLDYMEHVQAVVEELEASVEVAEEEGKNPQSVVENMHMIFHGPPGTGKTTCAKRFGIMFKHLNLLPRSHVEYVTGTNLMGQYVGHSENKTVEAMRRAKGGILFIDEAYALVQRGSYGPKVLQALLDNITTPEFHGKLVVVLGGYKHQLLELFDVNPGFQSRFDKKRVEFRPWTAVQATNAVVRTIKRDGKAITTEAEQAMQTGFDMLRGLPNWASARDAFELIYPNLQRKRNLRYKTLVRQHRSATGSKTSESKTQRQKNRLQVPYEVIDVQVVFREAIEARRGDDQKLEPNLTRVKKISSLFAFEDLISNRHQVVVVYFSQSWCPPCQVFKPRYGALADQVTDVRFAIVTSGTLCAQLDVHAFPTLRVYVRAEQFGEEIVGGNEEALRTRITRAKQQLQALPLGSPSLGPITAGPGLSPGLAPALARARAPVKTKVKVRVQEKKQVRRQGEGDDVDGDAVWAALEQACKKLGLSLEEIVAVLENEGDFPPAAILNEVISMTGCTDRVKLTGLLLRQRVQVLQRFKQVLAEANKIKTEQERKLQAHLNAVGQCCMGFDWLKEPGGWRCAGGSHFMDEDSVAQAMGFQ